MGDGLKRVARLCGGLTVTARGETVRYDGEGKKVSETAIEADRAIAQSVWPGAFARHAPERRGVYDGPHAPEHDWQIRAVHGSACVGSGETEAKAWAYAARWAERIKADA